MNSIIPWRNKTRSLQIKPSTFSGHLSLPTFWSPKRICLRAFLETFILHRKILFSPGSVELLGESESPPLVAELEPELVLIWRPLISSDWIEAWSCLSMMAYTLSPWINKSSWKHVTQTLLQTNETMCTCTAFLLSFLTYLRRTLLNATSLCLANVTIICLPVVRKTFSADIWCHCSPKMRQCHRGNDEAQNIFANSGTRNIL